MKKTVVRNIFIQCHGVRRPLTLKRADTLLRRIARRLDYTILGEAHHVFGRHAVTALLLLSESHLSLHTWPETNYLVFEMVTCKAFHQKEKQELVHLLRDMLQPKTLTIIVSP